MSVLEGNNKVLAEAKYIIVYCLVVEEIDKPIDTGQWESNGRVPNVQV